MKYFDENILSIIHLLEYDMYWVSVDKHIDCVCKNFNTQQGNPTCEHCLGTGHKVKIYKVKGVRQPDTVEIFNVRVDVEVGVYFFENKFRIKEDDYLIWRGEIEQVTKVERFCSDSEKAVYYRVETARKKSDTEAFMKNFCKAVGIRYYRR